MKILRFIIPYMVFMRCLFPASLDTVIIKSRAMQTQPKAVIILPDSYQTSEKVFPVLYLLHGWSGSYRDWAAHMDLRPLSDHYQFIIVCPDGGYAGWYLDSPYINDNQYETYIADEVVRFVDTHYRSQQDSRGRFICGLSMGGHGAISLLAKHPDQYAGAGSMSGVMTLKTSGQKYGISKLIGSIEDYPDRWQENSCLQLVEHLAGLQKGIVIDCGVDDFTIGTNRAIHQRLIDLNIPHDYYERPGGHSWDYWTNALEYHLLYFQKRLK